MKRIWKITAVLSCLASFSFAHTQNPPLTNPVLQHAKKVYVDSADRKVFWPQDKPFWLRIAESAESGAASYLLVPETKGAGPSSGIMLDKSGIQTLRWFNKVKGDTVRFRFVCDGEGPSCVFHSPFRLPFSPRPVHWFGTNMEGMIDSWDRLSGVDTVFLSFDNGPYRPLSAWSPKDLSEQWRTCDFYAIDRVGNVSTVSRENIRFDLTAPKTRLQATGSVDSIFSARSEVRLYAIDTLSGVKEILCRFDTTGRYFQVKDVVRFDKLSDGAHSMEYYATDLVGNKEQSHSFRFLLDNTAPLAALACSTGCCRKGDTWYVSDTSIIRIEAKDSVSGVDKLRYTVDNGRPLAYAGPIQAKRFTAGKHTLRVQVSDKVGNTAVHAFGLCMDKRSPETTISVKGPFVRQNGVAYLSPHSTVQCSAQDDMSGVKKIEWRLGERDTLLYDKPISLTKEGVCTLYCRAVDNVGNAERFHEVVLALDASAPQIMQMFSRNGVPSGVEDSVTVYTAPLVLYLGATDSLSGLESLLYSINNSAPRRYSQELHFDAPEKYVIGITATDRLGNSTRKSTVIRLKPAEKAVEIMNTRGSQAAGGL